MQVQSAEQRVPGMGGGLGAVSEVGSSLLCADMCGICVAQSI